ncbi:MAG: FxsA family protein [Bradymonadia bacterium]
MCGVIFIGLVAFGALELSILLEVGDHIGGFEAVALVIFTAMVGMYFARVQGAETLQRMQSMGMGRGMNPNMMMGGLNEADLLEGPLLVVAALFLIVPGFISDGLGFLLLVPPIRALAGRWAMKRLAGRAQGVHTHPGVPPRQESSPSIIVVKPRRPDEDEDA